MFLDPTAFLFSVARYAVARAAAQTPAVALTLGVNLFTNMASQPAGQAEADPYVVLRTFGGSNEANNPKSTINVQLAARGSGNVATQQFAQAVFEAIVLDAWANEARMVQVPAYDVQTPAATAAGTWMLVDARTINRPGQLGRDDFNRVSVVANFSLGFFRLN